MKINIAKSLSVVVLLITITTTSWAQVGTSSLYSRYGIGDLEQTALGQSLGLGGTGIALRTPYEINPLNPASYSAFYPAKNRMDDNSLGQVKYPNFMFQAGVRFKRTNSETASSLLTDYNYGLRSMAMGFHINKYWSASAGMMPYSSIGYQVNTEDSLFSGSYGIKARNAYLGTGGLSRLYLGNSFKYKQFSVGFNANYIFGNQKIISETAVEDLSFSSAVSTTQTMDIRGLMLDFGTQFSDTIADKFIYTLGAIYTANSNLSTYSTYRTQQTYKINSPDFVTRVLINDTIANGKMLLPQMYGGGFSLRTDKWMVAADYKTQNWSEALFLGETKSELTNSTTYSFGAEYTPEVNSDNFFKHSSYRIGMRASDYYLNVGGVQVVDNAVSLGIGIPLTTKRPGLRTPFRINIGFEAGQRGSLEQGMILENYYLVNMNFNMGSIWFIKKQFM